MRTKFFRWIGSTVLFALFFPCNPARAQIRVAHASQGFTSFQWAVINNAGVVCFSATKINASGHAVVGVYKGSGGGVMTVLENEITAPPEQLVPLGNKLIAMNDAGLVLLAANWFGQPFAYATRGTVTQPANAMFGFQQVGPQPSFSINNHDFVGSGGIVWKVDSNGASDPLYDECANCFGLLNNNDQLLFWSGDSTAGFNIFRVDVGVTNVNPNPPHVKTLGVKGKTLITTIKIPNIYVAMNDSGVVAYYATETNGMPAIFTTSRGAGSPFVEFRAPNAPPGTGPDLSQVGDNSFAINNSGQVAFSHSRVCWAKPRFSEGPML